MYIFILFFSLVSYISFSTETANIRFLLFRLNKKKGDLDFWLALVFFFLLRILNPIYVINGILIQEFFCKQI